MSSNLYLKTTSKAEHLHTDSTYKLLWQEFSVHIIRTTNSNRSSYCYGISVCNGETTADLEFIFHTIKFAIAKYFGVSYRPSVLISDTALSIKILFKTFSELIKRFLLTLIRCSNKITHKMFMGEKSPNYNF